MSDYWNHGEVGKPGITYRSGGLGALGSLCVDQSECAVEGIAMASKTVFQYLFFMFLPWEESKREIPAVTAAKLVSMSWPFCTISEDHVAGAVASLLETKKGARGHRDTGPSIAVLPWARSFYRHHSMGFASCMRLVRTPQGAKTRICKACIP